MKPVLQVKDVCKTYPPELPGGSEIPVLRQMDFTISRNSLTTLLGPAACGKSTLLNILAGLDEADSGTILLNEMDIHSTPRSRRTLVFSSQTMLPWLDVRSNIELGLRVNQVSAENRRIRAEEAIYQTGLSGYEKHLTMDLPPGLRQLTALARALALEPEILLMDEPFTNLDAQARLVLQKRLLRIQKEKPRTILFTTHDMDEAILLGDTIHLLSPRPGTITTSIPVELPHPRSHHAMTHPTFIQIKKQLMDILLV
ncbi:MAG: ABC transporter ATP-binding protein [Kiritimatiellae bacterium]|nr:ABC transporter ATP-binding protein [Kiritimatiellia bacterium]